MKVCKELWWWWWYVCKKNKSENYFSNKLKSRNRLLSEELDWNKIYHWHLPTRLHCRGRLYKIKHQIGGQISSGELFSSIWFRRLIWKLPNRINRVSDDSERQVLKIPPGDEAAYSTSDFLTCAVSIDLRMTYKRSIIEIFVAAGAMNYIP